jgi:hypothetical protein
MATEIVAEGGKRAQTAPHSAAIRTDVGAGTVSVNARFLLNC